MDPKPIRQLRVLLADEHVDNLEHAASVVTRLGHTVVAKETNVAAVAALTEDLPLDVAIVAVDENSEHALDLISTIVREAPCPVIAVLHAEDTAFIYQAAKRGVFAYITNGEASDDQFESAIDVVLHRFAEYHDLEGAFGRRALTERAKGILMERHSIDEHAAFLMLRDHARNNGRKLVDVAKTVLDARELLPANTGNPAPGETV